MRNIRDEKIRVVCIDDIYIIHEGIKHLLAPCDNIEIVAEGFVGEHVFPLVERFQPDVLLLDLSMPQYEDKNNVEQFQGIPTIEQLADDYPHVAIIIFTQFLIPSIIEGAIENGVKGYILKSDDLSLNLVSAITTVSKNNVYFSETISQMVFDKKRKNSTKRTKLTERQIEAITLVAMNNNATYAQLAPLLGIKESTFKKHLANSFDALGVSNITGAIIRCVQLGIIPFEGVIVTNDTKVHV